MEQAAIISAMTWRAGQRQWYVFLICFEAFDQTCADPENSVCGGGGGGGHDKVISQRAVCRSYSRDSRPQAIGPLGSNGPGVQWLLKRGPYQYFYWKTKATCDFPERGSFPLSICITEIIASVQHSLFHFNRT